MDDICRNYHGGEEESEAANESIDDRKAALRAKISDVIVAAGNHGMTSDQVEALTGMRHQTCSARFSEMKADGVMVWTGRKSPTRSGRMAKEFRINESLQNLAT
jgi:type IV pilus biogenesis protein CpaD/CtpE